MNANVRSEMQKVFMNFNEMKKTKFEINLGTNWNVKYLLKVSYFQWEFSFLQRFKINLRI